MLVYDLVLTWFGIDWFVIVPDSVLSWNERTPLQCVTIGEHIYIHNICISFWWFILSFYIWIEKYGRLVVLPNKNGISSNIYIYIYIYIYYIILFKRYLFRKVLVEVLHTTIFLPCSPRHLLQFQSNIIGGWIKVDPDDERNKLLCRSRQKCHFVRNWTTLTPPGVI